MSKIRAVAVVVVTALVLPLAITQVAEACTQQETSKHWAKAEDSWNNYSTGIIIAYSRERADPRSEKSQGLTAVG